jgi:hypothetical protein
MLLEWPVRELPAPAAGESVSVGGGGESMLLERTVRELPARTLEVFLAGCS